MCFAFAGAGGLVAGSASTGSYDMASIRIVGRRRYVGAGAKVGINAGGGMVLLDFGCGDKIDGGCGAGT